MTRGARDRVTPGATPAQQARLILPAGRGPVAHTGGAEVIPLSESRTEGGGPGITGFGFGEVVATCYWY